MNSIFEVLQSKSSKPKEIYKHFGTAVPKDRDADILQIIQPDMKTGPWIAGGAVLSWYNHELVGSGDIDIWCTSFDQANEVKHDLESYGFTLKYESKDAWTFKSDSLGEFWTFQVIIKSFYKTPEQIINDFDFTVCQLVTDGYCIVAGKHTYNDIKNRRLRINKPNDFLFKRLIKYQLYGYTPDQETLEWIEENKQAQTWNYQNVSDYES